MTGEDIQRIIKDAEECDRINICGIHYYSGTAKKLKQVEADMDHMITELNRLRENCGFECGVFCGI